MKPLNLIIFFTVFLPNIYSLADTCPETFQDTFNDSHSNKLIAARYFSAYVDQLYIENVITIDDLKRVYDELRENNKLENPIQPKVTSGGLYFSDSKQQIHFEQLENQIAQEPDKLYLLHHFSEKLRLQEANQEEKRLSSAETKLLVPPAVFYRISEGFLTKPNPEVKEYDAALYGNHGFYAKLKALVKGRPEDLKVNIKSFELMEKPLTMALWGIIMGDNKFQIFSDSNGPMSEVSNQFPASNISPDELNRFLARINETSDRQDDLIKSYFKDHSHGDKYRLPTIDELIFVFTQKGQIKILSDYGIFGDYGTNSVIKSKVASRKPIFVDGNPFYDLFGTLRVWLADFSIDGTRLTGGVDYHTFVEGKELIKLVPRLNASENVGIRLVREVRE